jgi:hypothetical protein
MRENRLVECLERDGTGFVSFTRPFRVFRAAPSRFSCFNILAFEKCPVAKQSALCLSGSKTWFLIQMYHSRRGHTQKSVPAVTSTTKMTAHPMVRLVG